MLTNHNLSSWTASRFLKGDLGRHFHIGHSSQFEVLEEARALAFFLQLATRLPQKEEGVSDAIVLGSDLCFDLLLDKIEIAMGVYRFPYSGSFDAPTLCIREG